MFKNRKTPPKVLKLYIPNTKQNMEELNETAKR
jgi:hypothetical protein